jgi:hypothetical protein
VCERERENIRLDRLFVGRFYFILFYLAVPVFLANRLALFSFLLLFYVVPCFADIDRGHWGKQTFSMHKWRKKTTTTTTTPFE